ncbi:MAG: DUF1214 domain-containing protein [Deltaproteobacteria bacterium]|jgi:hypothetical protein|nr:DUF1214 domain-containing protein [Deltaproteobacteria bacterium]MBW2495666.1 DUF1214 domain-containing protein [Deltaproteobacteria bacterium]
MSEGQPGEQAAVGGSGKSGEALRDELRGPERSREENAARLLSGEAWRDFCRALEAAGEHLIQFPVGETPIPGELRSEGMRYALGLVTGGVLQALQLSDPDHPRFVRNPDSEAKWGAENVDNQYLWARVRADAEYRISGNRRNIFEALMETKDGYMQIGDDRVFETVLLSELECESDGRFEILLAAKKPAGYTGNWIEMDPDTRYFCVRQYFADWEKEDPASFTIMRIGGEGEAPAPIEPARMAELLDEAGTWTLQSARFWQEWIDQLRRDHIKGEIQPPRPFVGGVRDIVYGNDWWTLEPDEAMIVECEVPDARYWQIQLCDVWFRTMDWATRQTGLNHLQTRVDDDGRFRVVIAHRDPGIQNWLDTGGHPEGMIQYRFVWTKDKPLPSVKIVPFDALRSALPPETPDYSAEDRRRALAIRHRHLQRREPVT